ALRGIRVIRPQIRLRREQDPLVDRVPGSCRNIRSPPRRPRLGVEELVLLGDIVVRCSNGRCATWRIPIAEAAEEEDTVEPRHISDAAIDLPRSRRDLQTLLRCRDVRTVVVASVDET